MGFPDTCDMCVEQKTNAHLFEGDLELGPRPLKRTRASVLLVGQDPTITKGHVDSVLALENPKSRLYRYIVHDILAQVGLRLEDTYATNLIKCRFPDNQTPKVIAKRHRTTMKHVLKPFFDNCQQWFLQEVQEIQPKVVLSFGEPVHQLLLEEFHWRHVSANMKDTFGSQYTVDLCGDDICYVPCIHINSKPHKHYRTHWNEFIETLRDTVRSAVL